MPYYNNNNNEEQQSQTPQPIQQAGNVAKKQAGKQAKKLLKKGAKAVAKAVKKAIMWFIKAVVIPFLPYFIAFFAFVILVYMAWDLIFNSRGKTQDYQTQDTQEYNSVEKKEETGEIVATDLSFGNKIVKAFYTYFSERSIYITCPDDGIDEPIQYNSPEFIAEYGQDGETEGFKDKYGREKMFYISPNALWSLDEFLNKGQFKFPEQFIKPVYNEGKDGDYALKQLTDENGELTAESTKYVDTSDKKYQVPKDGETELGVWDYGFGSILNYKKYVEEAKRMGTYKKIEVWNVETQEIDYVTLEEAKAGAESGKYEGYKDYIDQSFEEDIPSENKTSYMIDKVTSPAGTIINEIEQRWEDSGETFSTTQTRTEKVTVKKIGTRKEKVYLKCNESVTVNTYIDLDGKESKPKTIKNDTCKEDDHTLHLPKAIEYEVTYEYTEKEEKTLSVSIEGTIHRNIPRYVGSPDTSQITGSQYYRDYIRYYTTYAPESVLTQFDFKSIRSRTGKTDEELLEMLEREPFGGSSSSSSGNFDFEFGDGAVSDAHKKALQHWSSFEKYGNMYGVDPWIMVSIAVGESTGDHNASLGNCHKAGCGILQIEAPGITIKSATAYNQETGQMDVMQVTQSNAKDVDTNIKIGTMLMAERMKKNNYNILMTLQSYNMGPSFEKHVMGHYLKQTGITLEEAQADVTNLSWLDSVVYFHLHPTEFISWNQGAPICKQPECPEYGVSGNHYGAVAYVPRFMKNFASPNKEMWVVKEDGTKISLALDGTLTISEGTGGTSGIGSGWIKKLWDKFTDKWKSIFPDLPDELAKERTKFEHKVPETQIDTIIKMMFVMEEQKYLIEYDDWTDEVWKEKFALLFSNPVGEGWGSGGNGGATVDVNQYFPNGFDLPLSGGTLTIKKGYSTSHMAVDIVAPKGSSVIAVADGEVVEIGNSTSKGGKYIKIKHENGVYTTYGNLENTSVKEGDKVTRGQSIGTTGSGSEGEVLHFELAKGDAVEDPTWMITGFFNASDYNMTEEDAQIINQVIAMAKTKIGLRYTQDACCRNGPNSFDCSGFVNWLYKQATGVSIGSWTGEQEQLLKNYAVPMSEIQPGDVIFGPGHVTLYIGNGRIIHASNPKPYPAGGVKESNLYSGLNRAYRPIAYIRAQQGKK